MIGQARRQVHHHHIHQARRRHRRSRWKRLLDLAPASLQRWEVPVVAAVLVIGALAGLVLSGADITRMFGR